MEAGLDDDEPGRRGGGNTFGFNGEGMKFDDLERGTLPGRSIESEGEWEREPIVAGASVVCIDAGRADQASAAEKGRSAGMLVPGSMAERGL